MSGHYPAGPATIPLRGRRRTSLRRDDRPGGHRRGHRDPGVLRNRLRAGATLSVGRRGYTRPSMGALAVFGITNDGLNLAVNLLILFLVVIWLALVYWTYADARRRIGDPLLVGCATAASLFPFVGTDRLPDRAPAGVPRGRARARARDRRRRGAAGDARAPALPVLRLRGREGLPALPELPAPAQGAVHRCGKPLDPRWKICPYCEAEVGQAPAEGRRRAAARRAAAAAAGAPAARPSRGAARRPPAGRPAPREPPAPRGLARARRRRPASRRPIPRGDRWTGP